MCPCCELQTVHLAGTCPERLLSRPMAEIMIEEITQRQSQETSHASQVG